MRSFFRCLEKEGVRYLLISGQACILDGAAPFTEDIDLWVRPTAADLRGLLRAPAKVRGHVRKRTPIPGVQAMKRGHRFHFILPPDAYIDVRGRPPRVGTFEAAAGRSRSIATDGGRLPVVAPEDPVLLERTNCTGDDEAVSNLVRARVAESPDDLRVLR